MQFPQSGDREDSQAEVGSAPPGAPRAGLVRARRLTVVVPTFNEAQNIEQLVWTLLGLKLPGVRLSVLIVDDNSPDGTGAIADGLASRHAPRVSVLHRPRREGLGRAYVHAFGMALVQGADLIVQMDADHSHDPRAIPSLLAALPGADMVLGSRFVPGSRIAADWPRSRRLLAWFANSVYVRVLLGSRLADMTGGFRLWRAETLSAMNLSDGIRSAGFAFQVEMAHVAQRLGFRVREVPITFADRTAGHSKMSLGIQLEAAWRAWELKWRYRQMGRLESPSAGAREVEQAVEAQSRTRAGFWQQRYLLKHYRELDDTALAAGSGLFPRVVGEFLAGRGAVRSAGDCKRIEKRGAVAPPVMFTPARALGAITRLESRPLTPGDLTLVALLFVGSLLLYAITCARTVTGEDAGEFLAAAHGFGVPHPPGYPLWMLLAWVADHASNLVSVAWRVAMVSAVFSAAANALLLAVLLKTVRSRLAAFTAAALFAVSLTHWTQAVIPEVYGLNTFFIALQVLLLVRLAEKPTTGRLVALAAVTGLSCTNHTSAVPLGAVFGLGAALVAPRLFRSPRAIGFALVASLLPAALYFVLPLASARHPYDDWGHTQTLDALWKHVTRQQYAEVEIEQQAAGGYADYLRRLGIMADWAAKQFGAGWLLLLAAIGVLPLFVRQTGLWLLLVAIGWLSSVGITQYTVFPFEREHVYAVQIFWIPAWLVLAWLVGGGLDVLLRIPTRRPTLVGSALACAALVAWPGSAHFARADRSRTTAIADYGKAILDVMEPDALYFPSSDHSTFAVMYWQGVEGYRPDVVLADKYGRIEPEYLERFLDPTEHEIERGLPGANRRAFQEAALVRRWPGPVYFANRRESGDLEGRRLEPVGPIFKVTTPEEGDALWAAGQDGALPPGLAAWDGCLPLLDVDERQRLDFTVQMVEGDVHYMRGYALLRAGRLDEAQACWSTIHGDLAPLKQAFNNIGSALAENNRLQEALPFFEQARAEDSRYTLGLRNEALVLRNLGDTAGAIELLQRLAELDPEQRDSRLALAHLLDDADRPIEALAEFEALAAADPKDPAPWRDGGELLSRRGDRIKAQQALREALRLAPNDARASDDLKRLSMRDDVFEDQLAGMPPSLADESDPAPGSVVGPSLPPLPRDPTQRPGFDPVLGGATAPR